VAESTAVRQMNEVPDLEWIFFGELVPGPIRNRVTRFSTFLLVVVLSTMSLGLIANLLAWLANASVNTVTIYANLMVPRADSCSHPIELSAQAKHGFGYLGELNHGLFYFLAAPGFVGLSIYFLRSVGLMVGDLLVSHRLRENTSGHLANKIKRWFPASRRIFVGAVVLFIVLNFWIELTSRGGLKDLASNEEARQHAIGYVQTDFLKTWESWFNSSDKGARAGELSRYVFDDILRARLSRKIEVVQVYEKLSLGKWIDNKLLNTNVERGLVLASGSLKPLAEQDSLSLRARTQGGRDKYALGNIAMQWAFLIFVLILEGSFQGFVAWFLFKIGFFIVMLHSFVPDGGDPELTLHPFLYDPEFRFGLDLLFQCYNWIAFLIALGSSFLVLVDMNNVGARDPNFGFQLSPLNVVGICAVLAALIMLIFGPPLFSSAALKTKQTLELEKLFGQLGDSEGHPVAHEEEKRIYEDIRLVRGQKSWPLTDKTFLAAIAFCFIMLMAPFPLFAPFLSESGQYWISLTQVLDNKFHGLISPDNQDEDANTEVANHR